MLALSRPRVVRERWLWPSGEARKTLWRPHLLEVLVQRKLVVVARVLALLALGDGGVEIHQEKLMFSAAFAQQRLEVSEKKR